MIGELPEISEDNRKRAEEFWMYGASPAELAKAWGEAVAIAELQQCGNCEYFCNKLHILKALKLSAGQGVCKKFYFACSQDNACQAWECGEEDEEDYSKEGPESEEASED